MNTVPGVLVAAVCVAAVCVTSTAWAGGVPTKTVYVDCAVAPGGSGSYSAPYDTITAAVPVARTLSATYQVTMDVAAGTCQGETFPITLDFPVLLRGKRIPRYDGEGFPIDGQYRDTVVTWPSPPSPIPAGMKFFAVTGDGVRVSRISIDGKVPRLPDGRGFGGPLNPIAIEALSADGFVVEHVRVVGVGVPFNSIASEGVVLGSYLSTSTSESMIVHGGDAADPPTVFVLNNRLDYRTNGFVASGGTTPALSPGSPGGHSLELVMIRNDIVTTYTDTSPTGPNAIRLSPLIDALDGSLKATLLFNRVRGAVKYDLVHGGSLTLRGVPDYTGVVEAVFVGTTLDAAAAATARTVIPFTGIGATALPCELDPSIPRIPDCPTATNRWEYIGGASYDLWHSGELDGALIDHPEFEPVDGRELGNLLIVNDEVVDYGTFVVVP